jgi:transposase-like protein
MNYVNYCPKCGGSLKEVNPYSGSNSTAWSISAKYTCNNCNTKFEYIHYGEI